MCATYIDRKKERKEKENKRGKAQHATNATKYLEITITNTNDIDEELKHRIKRRKCMLIFT